MQVKGAVLNLDNVGLCGWLKKLFGITFSSRFFLYLSFKLIIVTEYLRNKRNDHAQALTRTDIYYIIIYYLYRVKYNTNRHDFAKNCIRADRQELICLWMVLQQAFFIR